MFRIYVRRFYYPLSINTKTELEQEVKPFPTPPLLCELQEFWRSVKENGYVPFEIVLCAYTKKHRLRYQIDLVRGKLLKDFREGHLPAEKRDDRTPKQLLYLDKILSSHDLTEIHRRVLELSFEMEFIDPGILSHTMKMNQNIAKNNLIGLAKKELLTVKSKGGSEVYIANIDEIVKRKGEGFK